MTDFNWSFESLDRKVNDEVSGKEDVIVISHWRLVATDGEYSSNIYGACPLNSPDPDNFTVYADVTRDMVKAWTLAALAEAKTRDDQSADEDAPTVTPDDMEKAMQELLTNQIAMQKNPPVLPGVPNAWGS